MKIGTVIRKYRKNLGMTQEEIANRLGVTTPAVNKWENNNTLPDVALLAPIARLLGITTDELLSFKEELTTKEIDHFTTQIQKDFIEKDFDTVFLLAKHKIEEYPNCEELILEVAGTLHANLSLHTQENIPNEKNYIDTIFGWYEQCLHSENEKVRTCAAISLFDKYFKKKDYETALQYTKYFSDQKPNRKFFEAMVYSKTNQKDKAYKAYEELIFSKYSGLYSTLTTLCMLYVEDENIEMASKIANLSSAIAASFEMGKFHEIGYAGLAVAALEKDVTKTEQLMRTLLDNIGTELNFRYSSLYQHMTFNDMEDDEKKYWGLDTESKKKWLIDSYKDKKFDYMHGNEWYEKLISSND